MFARFATQSLIDDCEIFSEFYFICSHLRGWLLSVKHEIELRNRGDLEILSRFSVLVNIDCAKNYVFIWVAFCCWFKCWLETNTWRAPRWPKIYDNTLVVFDNFLKLNKTCNFESLTVYWFAWSSLLHLLSTHAWHTASTPHLLHHLLHHLWILCHLLHHLWIHATLLHHLLNLWIIHHLLHHLWVLL